MREINKNGNGRRQPDQNRNGDKNGNGYRQMQQKRKLNKKRLAGVIVLIALIAVAAVFGIRFLFESKGSSKPDETIEIEASGQIQESIAGKSVVVDAGHGGFDPGALGADGTYESDLNIAVAGYLKEALENAGLTVIMTRSDANALAETKDEDMAERRRIIKESNSDVFVSIHMNALTDTTVSGSIVLFMPGSVQGEKFAKCVQSSFNSILATDTPCGIRSEELYVLESGPQPAILIECGFISNPEEEALLMTTEYQKKLANTACAGVVQYLSTGEQKAN